jgi:hypothetical protein
MAARKQQTIDPQQINDPAEIPPQGAHPVGLSPQGLVDVYCGTIPGDTGAQPSAKELLGPAPDTGGLANADYIYKSRNSMAGRSYPRLRVRPETMSKRWCSFPGAAKAPMAPST